MAAGPGGEPERFFFVHLQKTAGTALWRRLREQFSPEQLYPGPGDGDPPDTVLHPEHLVARWRARRDEIVVVTGHFPLCTVELLDAPFRTFTLLREPVERTLSYLRHHREQTPDDRDRSLAEIYDDPVRFELVHNHMTKMLSLEVAEMTNGALSPVEFDDARLARAQERLAAVDVVGFQEEFDHFCAELTDRFGWDLGKDRFMNRSAPADVPAGLRERIERDNASDVALYAWARAHRA